MRGSFLGPGFGRCRFPKPASFFRNRTLAMRRKRQEARKGALEEAICREASRCVAEGRTASPAYPPASSIALAALTERIRAGWGMRFDGEG